MPLLTFSSLLGTQAVNQSKIHEIVAVDHNFSAFIKSGLGRRAALKPHPTTRHRPIDEKKIC